MKKLLVAIALAASAAPASAQIAAAIGRPLPAQDLPAGTVSVRVIAGSPSSPVEGTDVTLVVNGTPRVARTDSAGRAIFKDLPAGATVQAKVLDADKKETSSETFPLSGDSGVRLMLSTKPFQPGAGMAGGAGGAMPDPINMSGQPRPEQNDPAGQFTVRLTYDDFADKTPPTNVPVWLVAYHADDSIEAQLEHSDKEGRATFRGLDRAGTTAYFALAQLPRNNAIDRLVSMPVTMDGRAGIRLILSSQKHDSTEPPIDELSHLDKQDSVPPDGKVRVSVEGLPTSDAITLFAIGADHKRVTIGKAMPKIGAPDPSEVMANAHFEPQADLPAGTVELRVHGGAEGTNEGLANVAVRIVKKSALAKNDFTGAIESKTGNDGTVRVALQATEPVVALVTINGKEMTSPPFDLAKGGGTLEVTAQWPGTGKPEAEFDVPANPDTIYFAETSLQIKGETTIYHSAPFQAVPGKGTHVSLFIFPRILFQFSLTSQLDDQYLVVGGRFEVSNNSWAPYYAGKDGLLLPMPKGFQSAQINEDDQNDVGTAEGQGFRVVAPIPPGGRQFHAQFALPVRDGSVSWDMDLPLGVYQSGMELMHVPGSEVHTPPNVQGQLAKAPNGQEFFVLENISILPKQRMVLSIDGLPALPSWRVWVPRVVGVFVVLVMLGGLGVALGRRAREDGTRAARRQALLDELVELERTNKDKKRREAILSELEALWGDSSS
jgi:hypothetical protein